MDRWHAPSSPYLFCHEAGLQPHVTMVEALRREPGVDEVEVVLNKEYRLAEERVLGWLDASLAAWRKRGAVGRVV